MSSPARSASLPKATHPGGVNDSEQVTVFHPLNGSGARGTTGRSNPGRRKQKNTLKSFTRGITKQGWCFVRLYRTSPKFPPVYLFFFGVQNRCFLFPEKKKRFWPPPGRQMKRWFSRKRYTPSEQAKTNCKIKNLRFPTKEKTFFPARATPHP